MNPQLGGAFEPVSGTMEINELYLKPGYKTLAKLSKLDNETLIRHELEHFRQFSDVVRSEEYGIAGFREVLKKYYSNLSNADRQELINAGINIDGMDSILTGDGSALNSELYNSVVKEAGKIAKGSEEAAKAAEYAKGLVLKSDPATAQQMNEAINAASGLFERQKAFLNEYKKNILEKEAYAAQDLYAKNIESMRPTIAGDNVRLIAYLEGSEA